MKRTTPMRELTHEDYEKLREDARVIEADRHGDKVLLREDGSYIKLFRRKRWLSSAALYPYARRFADNLDALQGLGIPCPKLISLCRVPSIERDLVHYQPLDGETIRSLVRGVPSEERSIALRAMLGDFIASLHLRGIYFRSLHLGNIVLTPTAQLGLIDVADLVPRPRPLGKLLRARNMKHLSRYREEYTWLTMSTDFVSSYEARLRSGLTPNSPGHSNTNATNG
jgi:tRNA A-37 threonylcarbamoyl transferase component Bud32